MSISDVRVGAAKRPPRSLSLDMQRRIDGFSRLIDRLRAVPPELRTAWVVGQLRYAEMELDRLAEALALMEGSEHARGAAT